ncbi:MAG: outer membrane protein assembly factor BamE [Pseudomonadota bacterium]|nr:outer membrane protein assembly factor BamE [Pseudomonadota bacterium]
MPKFNIVYLLTTLICLVNLTGCDSRDPSSSKYGSSTQGINTDRLPTSEISKGMDKEEVKKLLGEPHVNPFYPNIWIYTHIEHDKKVSQTITITFLKDKVSEISKS